MSLSTFRWLQYYGEMESWHGLLPHTHIHTHTCIQIAQGRVETEQQEYSPSKKIKFEFSMLRQFGMFWPFESETEHESNAVCHRAECVDQAPVELSRSTFRCISKTGNQRTLNFASPLFSYTFVFPCRWPVSYIFLFPCFYFLFLPLHICFSFLPSLLYTSLFPSLRSFLP